MEDSPRRKPYSTVVTDEEWAFVTPYRTRMDEDAPERRHDLRALLRWTEGRADDPTAAIFDPRTVQRTPESGAGAGYDGPKRRKRRNTHLAIDTLGLLPALPVTPPPKPRSAIRWQSWPRRSRK